MMTANRAVDEQWRMVSFKASVTCYYPTDETFPTKEQELEGGSLDMMGNALKSLEDFVQGRAPYVSCAMDRLLGIPYGTRLIIATLDVEYQKEIVLRVVDCGGAFRGKGLGRLDICRANKEKANDALGSCYRYCSMVLPRGFRFPS